MTILFGRTQDAFDTPFEPNRNGSEISADNVQEAIEEAKLDALNNDRFILLSSYGGNAGTGRYLEFFPAIDSLQAPIFLSASSRCITIVLGATSASTGSISFFDLNTSATAPIYTISLVGQSRIALTSVPTLPLFFTSPNARIALRVTSGSIAKPFIYFTLSANT